jgi:hypothetical protein
MLVSPSYWLGIKRRYARFSPLWLSIPLLNDWAQLKWKASKKKEGIKNLTLCTNQTYKKIK